MERVLVRIRVRFLLLLSCLLLIAQSVSATTVIIPSDEDMVVGARAIVRAKVLSVGSSLDEEHNRIFTYITLRVQEVIKGQISERKIVLKEEGGQVGDRGSRVFGTPQFKPKEKVLLYLDTWADGSLRVHQMFLGKYSIVEDEKTGRLTAVRSGADGDVLVLSGQSHNDRAHNDKSKQEATERMELSAFTEMIRSKLAANLERSREFEERYYRDVPMLASPPEYGKKEKGGEIEPQYTFLSPGSPPRWFEPDSGQAVTFYINTDGAPTAQTIDDVNAAMNAWSVIPNCALRVASGGTTTLCGPTTSTNTIIFNGCDGRWSASSCSGVLALGGCSWYGAQTKVVNGTTFYRAAAGFISFNPYASCYFGNHCNVQEVTTHELGHALGLGHSADGSATMYAIAHFDGRCASVKPDDVAGMVFMYPGTGGGGGPLSITSTSPLTNATVGSSYSQQLVAAGGTSPYTWSVVTGSLPTGVTLNAQTGLISGTPGTGTAGSYNFTVQARDSAATPATAQKAFALTVTATPSGAYDSQFQTQTVPATLQPNQTFTVNLKWLNTGTQTWDGATGLRLISQNPLNNVTWGGNAVLLNFFTVPSGQQLDITFQAYAPAQPGIYNFQWQVARDAATPFGQMSANVAIRVGNVPARKTQFDFDGDQKADTAVWRTGAGTWYIVNSQTSSVTSMNWGSGVAPLNDLATPADYDGDGKADEAVWRPATGVWYIVNSSNGASRTQGWGTSGDVPVPADYDGDGKADLAVFRPSTGVWFIVNSSNGGATSVSWGMVGDLAQSGDFDGDGKADVAVFRPSTGVWYVIKSSNGAVQTASWGVSGDVPVPADYDGDGKTDFAVWRPATGVWYVVNSTDGGVTTRGWGSSNDVTVPADYDGDGKADFAVWRPSTGDWWFVNSSNGALRSSSWGNGNSPFNDMALESAFIRR